VLTQEEIDSLLSSLSVGLDQIPAEVSASSAVLAAEKRNYTLYNFRRPDKFSKDHLRALQTIHDNFSRQMGLIIGGYLRMSVDFKVVSVDQLTYDEFIRSMPSPISAAIVEMNPLPGQILLGMSFEVASAMIDRMLGGYGLAESRPREMTDIEQSLIHQVMERTLVVLEDSWQSIIETQMSLVGIEDSYSLIQIVTPGEIVALITFEVEFGNKESGLLNLCFPFPVLEAIISQLSAQHIFNRQQQESSQSFTDNIIERINFAKLPISVYLGGAKIHIHDLMDLNEGDVIPLDRTVYEDLLICVNNKPKFYGRPGTRRKHLAVSVTEEIDNVEAIKGFGIDV
jgi:flagellar motor switch protein FliM